MKTIADSKTRKQIAKAAQKALDRHQPRKYVISVDPNNILEEDGWYHVLVTTPNDVRDWEFYDALAQAEAELQDQNGHQYLLVPVIAD
jgi:phage baseplate assembly protein W